MALADVEKARDFSRHGAHVQRVREILLLDVPVQFPLKLAFEKARCEIIEFDRLKDDEPVTADFPPALDVAGQMPALPELDDGRPYLEFGGRCIYGYGESKAPEDYPPKGVFYTPKGQVIDGAFARHQEKKEKSTRPLAFTPKEWRDKIAHAARPGYTKQWQELCAKYGDPPVPPGARAPPQPAPLPRAPDPAADLLVPAMPTVPVRNCHRVKAADGIFPFPAMVARPVSRQEVAKLPAAQAALQKEWDRLRAAGCWDETKVREWSDVASEARKTGKIAHMGRVFALCVEKGSELPAGDPGRKFKGRVVFQGNNVRDQSWDTAMFQDLGSSLASMEASKAADAYGLFCGRVIEQADAAQAYIQPSFRALPLRGYFYQVSSGPPHGAENAKPLLSRWCSLCMGTRTPGGTGSVTVKRSSDLWDSHPCPNGGLVSGMHRIRCF